MVIHCLDPCLDRGTGMGVTTSRHRTALAMHCELIENCTQNSDLGTIVQSEYKKRERRFRQSLTDEH